jgi:hypothetical protein
MRWNSGRRHGFVFVVNVIDVGDVRDIRDVGYIADVGNVHCLQIVDGVVIPGKERLAWSKRKSGD